MMTGSARKNETERVAQRPPSQREILRDVMLSATACDTWLSLDELSRMTSYPPASISAQLRHLRKERYGGYGLGKRQRAGVKLFSPVEEPSATGPVWEYQLSRREFAAPVTESRGDVKEGDAKRKRIGHESGPMQTT